MKNVKWRAWVLAFTALGCTRAGTVPPPAETVTVAPPAAAPAAAEPVEPPGDSPDALFSAALPSNFEGERTSRPPVRVGALTLTGPRSAELTQHEILARLGALRKCHEAAQAKTPHAGGSMRVRLVVLGSGAVKTAQIVQKQASLDWSLADCALRELARITFPRAVPGTVEVAFPVYFAPNP
ncbi:MAG: AgmX/PglI C-terminal domain-containing protein [Myxococcales bacterium]|jgi:hypothetical protein|nr:AgmX/PglI C-terminal domain-containing protein [Myxococcales bacterium]